MQPIMIMINYWDKKLKKRLYVLEADIITIEKKKKKRKENKTKNKTKQKQTNIDLMSQAKRMHFYRMCSKWPPLCLSQK